VYANAIAQTEGEGNLFAAIRRACNEEGLDPSMYANAMHKLREKEIVLLR